MRWPWSPRPAEAERLDSLRREIAQDRREIEQDRREIAATKPLVEEAIKRTNERYIAVEEARLHILLECALVRDLTEGLKGSG